MKSKQRRSKSKAIYVDIHMIEGIEAYRARNQKEKK